MAEVSIEINGRKYRMACEDGQEDHLQSLGLRFDKHVSSFKGDFGEIGDNRLTVMAGISVMDSLVEAERRLESLKAELDEITRAGQALAAESEELETRFASRMSEAARKIELAASVIEAANQDGAEN
ncbi:cell division protein ZapA [Mariluticola halotolerans]|uniref:cell division protein ZapA n=1 Tax=Mariluticola halotolerans TaxID=2909283 RepID=UPI0026E326DE|nr:cell division protein ZapA [Mariluticola halotolerans]UJQ94046.1 cell division protein ZapA [Mariluticola halotolerans]